MPNKFSNYSIPELYGALREAIASTEEGIARAASILSEIKRRGEHHPAMREGVFRYHDEIDQNRLTPKAAFTFAGNPIKVSRLIDLPAEKQNAIADGEEIDVAEFDADGKVVVRGKVFNEMSMDTLNRVFNRGKIRSVKEQERLLRKAATPTPPRLYGGIRADESRGIIICGSRHVQPHELREPLRALGYRLTRIPAANG